MGPALLDFTVSALELAVWLSLPALLAAWAAGMLSAGFASLTRLGDASTASVPRQLAVVVAIALSAAWAGRALLELTGRLWAALARVGGG